VDNVDNVDNARPNRRRYLSTLACLVVSASLLGCTETEADAESDPPLDRPEPAPYDPELETPPSEASFGPEQIALAIPAAVELATSVRPELVLTAFEELWVHADDTCPAADVVVSEDGKNTDYFWINSCLSEDGTFFSGVMLGSVFEQVLDDGTLDQGFTLNSGGSSFIIYTPEGEFLQVAAYMEVHTYTYEGGMAWGNYFTGNVLTDPARAGDDPLLNSEIEGTVYTSFSDYLGDRSAYVGGNFTGPLGDAISGVMLDEIVIADQSCALEVYGGAHVRDVAGAWHDADFGSSYDDPDPEGACEACGTLAFDGEMIGEFCSNETAMKSFIGWETAPW